MVLVSVALHLLTRAGVLSGAATHLTGGPAKSGSGSSGGSGGGEHHTASLAAAGILTSFLIAVSLTVEFSTEFLEEFLEKKHLLPMLYHVYKEIMILGLCSLLMFFEEQYHFMDKLVPGGAFDHHLFHSIHMTLFLTVMIYVSVISFLLGSAMLFANGLKKMEARPLSAARAEFRELDEKVTKMGSFSWLNPFLKRKHAAVYYEVEYQSVRAQFIKTHELPEDYAFFVYLRKCTREKILHMGGVHWTVWVMILLFVFINTIRTGVFHSDLGGGNIEFFVILYLTFFFATAVHMKTRKIVRTLLEGDLKVKKADKGKKGKKAAPAHRLEEDDDDNHEGSSLLHRELDDNHAKEHRKLFWFGKPGFLARSVQFTVLVMALLMPLYFQYFRPLWHNSYNPGEELTLTVSALLPMFIILFVYMPRILPGYVFATSIGEMFNEEAMEEATWKTPSYIAEHGVHKHEHHHDHAAVIHAEHGGGHGHGKGGHGHGGGHGGGGHDDGHGDGDAHGSARSGHSEPKKRSTSRDRGHKDHH